MLTHSHMHASYAQCVEEDSATNSQPTERVRTQTVGPDVVTSELIHQFRKSNKRTLHLLHTSGPLTLLLSVGLLCFTFPGGATSRDIIIELLELSSQSTSLTSQMRLTAPAVC